MLMPLKRLEGRRLSAPQQLKRAVQMLDHLDRLRPQCVARLLRAGDHHQQFAHELAGQRFGQPALKVMGADARQRLCIASVGPVRVLGAGGHAAKAGIVLCQVLGQPGVGRSKGADPGQAQRLDQTVLQRLERPLVRVLWRPLACGE